MASGDLNMSHYLYVVRLQGDTVLEGPMKVRDDKFRDLVATCPRGERLKAWKVTDKESPTVYEADERPWWKGNVKAAYTDMERA